MGQLHRGFESFRLRPTALKRGLGRTVADSADPVVAVLVAVRSAPKPLQPVAGGSVVEGAAPIDGNSGRRLRAARSSPWVAWAYVPKVNIGVE
jgi:hypothetical protein